MAVWVTPCPVEATRSCLKEFYFGILHLWFCSLLKSAHCYHNNNNEYIVPLVASAGNGSTVLSVEDVTVETAEGTVVSVLLM